jgi:hypothetical protein
VPPLGLGPQPGDNMLSLDNRFSLKFAAFKRYNIHQTIVLASHMPKHEKSYNLVFFGIKTNFDSGVNKTDELQRCSR